jgi:hypothetical protein
MSMNSTYDPTIPYSEYVFVAVVLFIMPFTILFLMCAWDVAVKMRRDRRRGSYERHPSQRNDLYRDRNRGTVRK